MKTNSLFEKPKKSAINITVDSDLKETLKTVSNDSQVSISKIINLIIRKLKDDNNLENIETLEEFLRG
jgi:antitoxin component of RelBE/YafQ-DinJ toxin-antitoxin module